MILFRHRTRLAHAATEPSNSYEQEQKAVTRRYDRMAPIYDVYDAPIELMGTRRLRKRLVQRARGKVLEVGVGTGKNLPHYPEGTTVTGIDLSSAMLSRARTRSEKSDRPATLLEGDARRLPFSDGEFDTTLATCVYCSVADPVAALRELGRVTDADGQILLLEHVRPRNRVLGRFADLLTRVTVRLFGFHVNRRTEDNLASAGLEIRDIRRIGVWREITALRASAATGPDAELGITP